MLIHSSSVQLDMLIEQNAAAIRVLEPIVQMAKDLPPEQAKRSVLQHTRIAALCSVIPVNLFQLINASVFSLYLSCTHCLFLFRIQLLLPMFVAKLSH